MLNSSQLNLVAEALSVHADNLVKNGDVPESNGHVRNLRIAADDARREMHAASGYSSPADLALHIVVDSDRRMVEHLTAVALRILTGPDVAHAVADVTDYPDLSAEQQVENLRRSYLADALHDELRSTLRERVVETASMRTIYGDDPDVEPEHRLRMASVEMVSAMAAHALDTVDWMAFAGEYIDRALGRGEYAKAVA